MQQSQQRFEAGRVAAARTGRQQIQQHEKLHQRKQDGGRQDQHRHQRHAVAAQRNHRAHQGSLAGQALQFDLDNRKTVGNHEHDEAGYRQWQQTFHLASGIAFELGAATLTAGDLALPQYRFAVHRIAFFADDQIGTFMHHGNQDEKKNSNNITTAPRLTYARRKDFVAAAR